jgi:putative endonuclease
MQPTKFLGNQGEEAISKYLQKQGFTLLARNYQTRSGEVDVIATKDDVVAFVEVKTRHINYFPIAQTVTYRKQQRIIKAARSFILANKIQDKIFRFDVATVIFEQPDLRIEYIANAFGPR